MSKIFLDLFKSIKSGTDNFKIPTKVSGKYSKYYANELQKIKNKETK